jgi:hypothetical protein
VDYVLVKRVAVVRVGRIRVEQERIVAGVHGITSAVGESILQTSPVIPLKSDMGVIAPEQLVASQYELDVEQDTPGTSRYTVSGVGTVEFANTDHAHFILVNDGRGI